jgi:hypothetical protein
MIQMLCTNASNVVRNSLHFEAMNLHKQNKLKNEKKSAPAAPMR